MVVRFHPTPQKLNDRMVRVYEGDALQTRLEKSTSGVRISLRSQNNLPVSSNRLGRGPLKVKIRIRVPGWVQNYELCFEKIIKCNYYKIQLKHGVLVQLARTSALQAGGRRFESDILHNKSIWGLSLGGRLMTSK